MGVVAEGKIQGLKCDSKLKAHNVISPNSTPGKILSFTLQASSSAPYKQVKPFYDSV